LPFTQNRIHFLETQLANRRLRLETAGVPAELTALVSEDVKRFIKDDTSGSNVTTIRNLLLVWHESEAPC